MANYYGSQIYLSNDESEFDTFTESRREEEDMVLDEFSDHENQAAEVKLFFSSLAYILPLTICMIPILFASIARTQLKIDKL